MGVSAQAKESIPKKILWIRVSAIIETLVFLSLAILFDQFFGKGDRYLHTSPHPFTIIVLLIAVQYGTLEGIFSTLLATIFLYAWNVPAQSVGETIFDYQFHLAILPLTWFVASFVFGEIRARLDRENQRLREDLNLLGEQAEVVSREYKSLKETKENLEAYIVSQKFTMSQTYSELKKLDSINPARILLNINDVVKSALNVKKFSVYGVGDKGFEVLTSYGWKEGEKFLLRIPREHPLYEKIADEHRLVCSINENDEAILKGEGILAGPLLDIERNEVFGMLKIEEMEFMDLNISSIETFKNLCELIGASYVNALHFKEMQEKSMYYSKEGNIFSLALYEMQMAYLIEICIQLKRPLRSIVIAPSASISKSPPKLEALARSIRQVVPVLTQFFYRGKKEGGLILLLPFVGNQECEGLATKIYEVVHASFKEEQFIISPQIIYEPDPTSQKDISI